jgi:ubiquinone/menaquinone biosynthesis C-methylase UbiE
MALRTALFDVWSRVYDLPPVQRAIYRPNHDAVVGVLRDPQPARVLDVGCGTGILAARLRRELRSTAVVGLDFSAGMLEQAAKRSHVVPWVRGDALHLPFGDAQLDAAVSTEAFHWFPDHEVALRELHRVLRPGGRLLLILGRPRTNVGSQLFAAASRAAGQPGTWPTAATLQRQLEAAGFTVEVARTVRRIGEATFPSQLTVATRR